ncbi:hypothetical protein YTPLAS18_11020 [Nitrospira sp.]|nr:hypothetical protein YTPLAS18_11020 [Nitrospira sp.]
MRDVLGGLAIGVLLGAIGTVAVMLVADRMSEPEPRVSPEKTAEYIHAVVEANRINYTENVVNKMHDQNIVEAVEHWREEKGLPLPAQFLMESGRLVAQKNLQVTIRLASLTPLYVWNSPTSDFERKGLQAVLLNPERPVTGFLKTSKGRWFQAIYPDRAISSSCVDCHNKHPNSPRRDYKLDDVMGGIIITIPVED